MIVNINKIKPNPKNPRVIKDDKFVKLKKSIEDFPDMLNKRPLVVFTDIDEKYVVLGGNMRLKAAKELGLKELPIIIADEWTEEQKAEFLIKDNVGFGEWDWDILSKEWNVDSLDVWGLSVPIYNTSDIDLDTFFEEDNTVKENKFNIILEYNEEDYNLIQEALKKHSGSKEQIIFKLLDL